MRKNYLKKGLIAGIIVGSIAAFSFLGYIYYMSKKHLAANEKITKSKSFKDLNLQLTNLDGTPADLTKFSDKHILMNFWATWCKPCLEEMPLLQKTYNDNEVKDQYVFILVADHDLPTIEKFKHEKGYNFVFVKANQDLMSKVGALPTTFILDKSQNIIFSQTGSFDNDEKKFKNFLLEKSKK
ncbi:Thiol-disulfide isomerase or thioredoxin [Chryseobacterium oleae]|uniref:Thiol-disulfide isomerase or thioredoxin n=1 Tax=Chryseobacterium oleae TaxID=491207 RepID=A0A1I4VQN5_CHROL|nr:TlpA disulfide reductase family protein [Chryseobacterium oleae]SFN03584.1 Thiol-disulfide isomerase or thioredoxin [Chryseobacterium oleae]